MSIELPEQLREALGWTGQQWPDGDEDTVLRFSTAWEEFGPDAAKLGDVADEAAERVSAANEGPAATRFAWWWRTGEGNLFLPKGPAKLLSDDERAATAVAAALSIYADLVLALKGYYLTELTRLRRDAEVLRSAGTIGEWLLNGRINATRTALIRQAWEVADKVNSDLAETLERAREQMHIVGDYAQAHEQAERDLTMGDIQDALDGTNPNFGQPRFDVNCVHCVMAYELRRRGIDVDATALPGRFNGGRPLSDIEDLWGRSFTGGDQNDIVQAFENYGPGARGVVYIDWNGAGAHVFNVENVNGRVVFVDGQNNTIDAADYFSRGGNTSYVRLDDLETPDVSDADEYVNE